MLTLNELRLRTLPNNWLFVFCPEQALGDVNQTIKMYLSDIVSNKRFNEFVIDESVDVTFPIIGFYDYTVYQMPDGGSLDSSIGHKVERGMLRVIE